MKSNLFLIACILFFKGLTAQTLPDAERDLARLGKNSIFLQTEAERLSASDSFTMLLEEILLLEEAFTYPFDAVKNLSKLISPDKNFRIFTWSVPLKNGSFAFYGRIVLRADRGFDVITLTDNAVDIEKPEFQLLKPDHWYGAVYYDIVKTKHKKTTYYTLLGYRPNQAGHHEKILEVISTENLENLRFGAKAFNTPILNGIKYDRPPFRLILRYNPKTVALLRYQQNENRIIMDHLAPPDASMQKNWATYGPDFTYDALSWGDGMWQLTEGIAIEGQRQPAPPAPVEQGLPDK